jgi:hypothetical protein
MHPQLFPRSPKRKRQLNEDGDVLHYCLSGLVHQPFFKIKTVTLELLGKHEKP